MRPDGDKPEGSACSFCAIAKGEAEATIVFADDVAVGFLDRTPLFPGHVLIIPRAHVLTLPDLSTDQVDAFFQRVQRVAAILPSALGSEGTFVANNNTVSQSVPHLHFHVVPRTKGDGLRGFFWPRVPYDNNEHRNRIGALIREAYARTTRTGSGC